MTDKFDALTPHTPCKHCVFAVRQDKTQVGCELGLLDKYASQDPDCLVDVFDEEGDEFTVVKGRACRFHRDKRSDWAGKFMGEEAKQRVREEAKLRFAVFVLVPEDDVAAVTKVAESLVAQALPPFAVYFVNLAHMPPSKLHKAVWGAIENRLTWRLITVAPEVDGKKAVDNALDAFPLPHNSAVPCADYYAVLDAGFGVDIGPDFLAQLDRSQNEDLERWRVAVTYHGLVCQVALHKHPAIGGNTKVYVDGGDDKAAVLTTLVDKVVFLIENGDLPSHVLKHEGEAC